MNSRERIAYLRGLLDFMPCEEKETKVYVAILDALDSLAADVEEHSKLFELLQDTSETLADEVDDLHDAIYELEESVGLDIDQGEEEDINALAESYISVACPSCDYSFYYRHDEEKGHDGEKGNDLLLCPACGGEINNPE